MNKEAYNFLNSARVLHWEYLRLCSKKNELELCLLPSGIRYDRDKIQSSPDDTISKIVAEINELEVAMKNIQIAKSKRIEAIDYVLKSLESDEERTALTMRYINRQPVSNIAEQMGYAESTIYKFMDQGGNKILKCIRNIK